MSSILRNQCWALLIFISFFLMSSIYADAFKCIDKNGNTIFQDSACSKSNKETKITLKKITPTSNSHCITKCELERDVCVADLGLGVRNTNKNLSLCEKTQIACSTSCVDYMAGRKLEELTTIERASYERKIRDKQTSQEIEEYQEYRNKILEERSKKRDKKHCRRYEKKLAKLKAKWKRKQQKGWTAQEETRYLEMIADAKDALIIECR